jgi:Holliday junction DNA helicase RuvA
VIHTAKDEALSALVMLGFAKNVGEKALDNAMKSSTENLTVEQLIKIALKSL